MEEAASGARGGERCGEAATAGGTSAEGSAGGGMGGGDAAETVPGDGVFVNIVGAGAVGSSDDYVCTAFQLLWVSRPGGFSF